MAIHNIVLLGPPGSGKSTQAHLLVDHFHMMHIETGAALKRVAGGNTAFSKALYDTINVRKELVSDGTVGKVLDYEMSKIPYDTGIVVDGAPRRISQIDEVEGAFTHYSRKIDRVIFIRLPEEVSVDRIASRFACAGCGKSYIIGMQERATHDLKCSDCGGALEQRTDDTPEGVRKRLDVFAMETLPVIERYRVAGILLEVDGTKSAEEIFQNIVNGLKN